MKNNFRSKIVRIMASAISISVLSAITPEVTAAPANIAISVTQGSKLSGSLTNDTATGAQVSVSAQLSAASDSVYVTIAPKSYPSGYTTSQKIGRAHV